MGVTLGRAAVLCICGAVLCTQCIPSNVGFRDVFTQKYNNLRSLAKAEGIVREALDRKLSSYTLA